MDRENILERIRQLTHPLSPVSVDHSIYIHQLKDIKCVAFDFYGTMFISAVGEIGIDEEQESQSGLYFAQALEDSGFSIHDDQAGQRGAQLFEDTVIAHVTSARNEGVDVPEPNVVNVWLDVLSQLRDEQLIEGEVTLEKARLFGIEFELRINDVWPVPDLKNVLQELLDQNLQLGIISNSQYYTPLTFEAILGQTPSEFGFNPDLLIWSYETGRKKPSRLFYKEFINAAEQKDISPAEVLYVGNDITKDIQPAKKLGMKTALYVGDERSIRHEKSHLEQEEYSADLVIDDLHQLLECL